MPEQIDLEPYQYRRKGARRFLPVGPFMTWATICGIFAGGFWYVFTNWIYFAPGWIVTLIGLIPAGVLFLVAILTEDGVADAQAADRGSQFLETERRHSPQRQQVSAAAALPRPAPPGTQGARSLRQR